MRPAAHAAWTRVVLSQGASCRTCVERRLPALSSLRGQSPAHETRCPAVGQRGEEGRDGVFAAPCPAAGGPKRPQRSPSMRSGQGPPPVKPCSSPVWPGAPSCRRWRRDSPPGLWFSYPRPSRGDRGQPRPMGAVIRRRGGGCRLVCDRRSVGLGVQDFTKEQSGRPASRVFARP